MIQDKLDAVIRTIPNFPKSGIDFKDITPLLLDSEISNEIVDEIIALLCDLEIDAVVGVESRGFLFGFLLANKLGVPFIPIRKSGKLPGETIKYKYEFDYFASCSVSCEGN